MKTAKQKKWWTALGGLFAGFLNGLFGTGGGMVVVPMLERAGYEEVKSHAMSVSIILPICVLSAGIYLWNGHVALQDALPYLPWMLGGSLLGAWLLPRCKPRFLHIVFGLLILWAAVRMVFG